MHAVICPCDVHALPMCLSLETRAPCLSRAHGAGDTTERPQCMRDYFCLSRYLGMEPGGYRQDCFKQSVNALWVRQHQAGPRSWTAISRLHYDQHSMHSLA